MVDFLPLNLLRAARLDLSSDWVCADNCRRKECVVEETEHGKLVQPNEYYVYKNMRTGETREYRKTSYGKYWKQKGDGDE